LKSLSENGCVIEVGMIDPNHWKKKKHPIEFTKKGLNKALSRSVFCPKHDSELLKSIENEGQDFTNIQHFILLNYRAVCAELRKK
jgi:hypothetical protein